MTERSLEAVGLFEERLGRLPRGGGVSSLQELVRLLSALPYENLSKILASEQATPRMPSQVMRDHLALGTGGTCFSLAELLRVLAGEAGFSCQPLMAHMRHGHNIHCALRVEAGGRAFLVDPGYLVAEPLELARPGGLAAAQPGQAVLVPAGEFAEGLPQGLPEGGLDLITVEPDGPRWRYRLSARAPTAQQFIQHWQASFTANGMRSLLATRRAADGALLYLHNHKLRRMGPAGKRTDNVRASLEATVEQTFGIDPDVTRRAAAIIAQRRQQYKEARGV